MLKLINLTKKYGNLTAVDNVNLRVKEGVFLGLLGPNGAGKTSIIRMVSTLSAKTSGDIKISNESIDRNLSSLKIKIGVVSQHNNLENEMSGQENLEVHGMLYKIPRKERKNRIADLLEFTGLTDRKDDLIKTYSGGMKRKLMIARALINKPKILLLDEPTVSLDAATRKKMWDLLKSLKNDGLTILLTTHYIEEAEVLCDLVALMNDGRLIELDTPSNLIKKVGNFTVEHFVNGKTIGTFFATREDAMQYAATLENSVSIRSSNLEDVFLKLTDRKVMQ